MNLIFLDHPRIARLLSARGVETTTDALVRAEGSAKRGLEGNGSGEVVVVPWRYEKEPGAGEWGRVIGTTIAL
ncbi:MAG TPA: hypothetical protein VNO21_24825, partial [Polyangiaceae bacterium]|nr:hypothetical protein [Polyangiaceae bacterium]